MDKVTTGAEPRAEAIGAVPSVESLLNSQAFRERLDAARRQRETALALRRDAAPEAILAAARPWEQADPKEIQRRRALKRDAVAAGAGAEPGARSADGRSTGAGTEPGRAVRTGPKSGFGALAQAMATGRTAQGLCSTKAAPSAPALTPTPATAEHSVVVLRSASAAAAGATMARAAAAMAALAEAAAKTGAGRVAGGRADGRAEPGWHAVPAVAWSAPALPATPQPVAPRRSRVLLAAAGFVLGLTMGAALAWLLARPAMPPPAPEPEPAVAASVAASPAAPAVAATRAMTGVIDVAARAPSLRGLADAGAEAGPAPPVTTKPPLRPAPAALPPVAAAPGPILHTPAPLAPAPLATSAARATTAPELPAGLVTLRRPSRQAPAELVASASAGPAPRAGATVPAPRLATAPKAPALAPGEADIAVVPPSPLAGGRGAPDRALALAPPLAGAPPVAPLAEATAAVPHLADSLPALPAPGPATGQAAARPGAGIDAPVTRTAFAAAPVAGAALRDTLPRVIAPPPAAPAPSFAGISLDVHAPGSIGDDALDRIVADLAGIGFAPNPVSRVGFRVRETHVRFYHGADADAAATLAQAAGATARDFTSFRPSPPAGTLELWLEGGAGATAKKPRNRTAPADPLAARKRALRDLLVEQLRRGDHL